MGYFPTVSNQGLVPHIYSTCQIDASTTVKQERFQAKWAPVRVKKTRQEKTVQTRQEIRA
jgi:hypothetical protein